MRTIVVLVLAAALAACSPPASKSSVDEQEAAAAAAYATPRPWNCDDGQTLTLAFLSDPQRLEIAYADGRRIVLPAAEAASGVRYGDAATGFHSSGQAGSLYEGDKETRCTLDKRG
jgi:membrane-bound inhibitor of C-type lysozyme